METFSAKNIFEDIRNYLAGRFVGATRDEFLLEEIVKLIFCKYEMKGQSTEKTEDIELSGQYRKKFREVIKKYPDIYEEKSYELELDPVSIKYVDSKLNTIDLFNIERDIIGDAYEIFIGDAIKGQSGQFFTPQNAAEALVQMVQPTLKDKVLDLTCGAGGFLVATIKYLSKNENDSKIKKFVKNNVFGVDKDMYLTRLAQIHIACLKMAMANIKCADSLVWNENILGKLENTYDVILTNPPFGTNIQAGTAETLSKFEIAYKYKKDKRGHQTSTNVVNVSVAPQVVFVEQCIKLVKPNGKIGIVVPESMISNKKYSYVNDYIMKHCIIEAVVGMPDELFKTSGKGGTHTKTCLLVLRKKKNIDEHKDEFFMAEAKWCGHDSRGREIPNDDIPQIVDNYLKYAKGKLEEQTNLGYINSYSKLDNNVLAPRSYLSKLEDKHGELSETHSFVKISQLLSEGVIEISTGNEIGKLAYGTGDIPFIRTSDISNWEIKSDPKHLVSEEIYEKFATKQDVRENDILMVKDGTYLIGTCAMITKYDVKMLYQSHLYKIRVLGKNKYNIDSYYLLAALSSDYVKDQIVSKTYSQDIINSLGDRLKELIIPISKNESKIFEISKMVKKSIYDRIEARELARKARQKVML